MLSQKEIDSVGTLVENFKPKITSYERKIFAPAIIDRIKYTIEIFDFFKAVCKKADVALHIDAPLKSLLDPKAFELGAPEPKVGEQYLAIVSRQCDTDFILPAKDLLARYPLETVLMSTENLIEFLNATTNYLQSIAGTKETLFLYSFRTFVSVKHLATGKIELGPPVEMSMTLMPFETRLSELYSVAVKTIESIEAWGAQYRGQKARHIDLIVSLSQTKASQEQVRATRANIVFQIAVIIFTVALVIGAERMNLFMEKRDLEKAVLKLEADIEERNDQVKRMKADIFNYKKAISELKADGASHKLRKTKED